jgi:hypothetical protein
MVEATHRVSVLSGVNYVPPTSSCKQPQSSLTIEHPIFKCHQVIATTETALRINIKPQEGWSNARQNLLNIAIASGIIQTVSLQPVHPLLPQILYMRHDLTTNLEQTSIELELDDNPDQPNPFTMVLDGWLKPWPRFESRIFKPDTNLQSTCPIELKRDQELPPLFLTPHVNDIINSILHCFLLDTESSGLAVTYKTLDNRTKRLFFQIVS